MRRLLTPAWLARHGSVAALVAVFLALGWWQIDRAAAGNTLSWAYAIEWPVFAGFVIFVWWREIRREMRPEPSDPPSATADPMAPGMAPRIGPARAEPASGVGAVAVDRPGMVAAVPVGAMGIRRPVLVRPGRGDQATPGDEDAELAAYNDYLAWLNTNPGAQPHDYPR